MRNIFCHVNFANVALLLITLCFLTANLSFAEELKAGKFSSYTKSKIAKHETNPELKSSAILVKKLKRRLKAKKDDHKQEQPQKRQVLNIESFLNQFSFLTSNRSSLFANSGSSSNSAQTATTRFAIHII